jgi:hypothetical protein
MYFNLKHGQDNNLKGKVGEVIAKNHLKKVLATRNYNSRILDKFNLDHNQLEFLKKNWKTLDLIELNSLTIYEVKTRKYFYGNLKGIKNKIKISKNFKEICKKAKELKFNLKFIDIIFFSDWKYSINIKDLKISEDFCVDKRKTHPSIKRSN